MATVVNHSMYYPEYEAAARELCRLRGEDPDIEVFHNADSGPLSVLYSPLWKRITREIHYTRLDAEGKALAAKIAPAPGGQHPEERGPEVKGDPR